MNYIFGNSTLYPRGGRANTATGHGAPGPKQRQWAKRSSSEDLPSSSSRWQQLLTFFTRRNAFSDCITAGAGQNCTPTHGWFISWYEVYIAATEQCCPCIVTIENSKFLLQCITFCQWE
ncbi:hypothetical protein SRHO_G00296250 [Serrasalmus rhombeus]